jgi:hypothetical protein
MSDPNDNPPNGPSPDGQPTDGSDDQLSQQVRSQHVSARVPEDVSRGVFSTGVILITGASEFVIDFIQNLGQPVQVVARVVMPHGAMPQFIGALRKNLEIYTQKFGAPTMPPTPPNQPQQRRLTVQEIYDEIKINDDMLSGVYSNGLMIGHTATEFRLDFLTNLYPHSAVSSRVFLSAPQIPRTIESLSSTFNAFQQKLQLQRQQPGVDPDQPPGVQGPSGESPLAGPQDSSSQDDSSQNDETPDG